jgi:hypothetical protein
MIGMASSIANGKVIFVASKRGNANAYQAAATVE